MYPVGDERLPVELLVVEVDHAAAGDCRSGRVLQGEHFKDQLERLGQFYALAVGQTEGFVVVKDGVQVFDPQGVRGTVEGIIGEFWKFKVLRIFGIFGVFAVLRFFWDFDEMEGKISAKNYQKFGFAEH